MQSNKQLPLIITATSGVAIAITIIVGITVFTGYRGVINIQGGLNGVQISIDGTQQGQVLSKDE